MGGCWREEGEVEEEQEQGEDWREEEYGDWSEQEEVEQGGNWRKVEYGDGNTEEYHGWRKE